LTLSNTSSFLTWSVQLIFHVTSINLWDFILGLSDFRVFFSELKSKISCVVMSNWLVNSYWRFKESNFFRNVGNQQYTQHNVPRILESSTISPSETQSRIYYIVAWQSKNSCLFIRE
jgi:hypothetical protein